MAVAQSSVQRDRAHQGRRRSPGRIDAPAQTRGETHERDTGNARAQFWKFVDDTLQRAKPTQWRQRRCRNRKQGEGASRKSEARRHMRRCLKRTRPPERLARFEL
jgi:hypothetical protein